MEEKEDENEEEKEEEENEEEEEVKNRWGGGEEEEVEEKKEEEEKKKRQSRDKVKSIKNKMNKNNAVIKYHFQNIVSSIIHISNSSKQFLNRPYL